MVAEREFLKGRYFFIRLLLLSARLFFCGWGGGGGGGEEGVSLVSEFWRSFLYLFMYFVILRYYYPVIMAFVPMPRWVSTIDRLKENGHRTTKMQAVKNYKPH